MEEIAVGKLADIAEGDYRIFAVEELEVGIFRTGSKVLAYENVCPHAGGPVCQGKILHQVEEIITPDKKSAGLRFGKQRHIVCPWHGYEFDLATGCHPGDASVRLTPVKVAVRDGQIYVSVPRGICAALLTREAEHQKQGRVQPIACQVIDDADDLPHAIARNGQQSIRHDLRPRS